MSALDFEIKGQKYKANKLDAFAQLRIVKRIGPLLSDVIPVLKDLKSISENQELGEDQRFDALAKIAAPILTGLSKLSDEQSDEVLIGLLCGVEIEQSGHWARVASGKSLMFKDLDLVTMLQLASKVFAYNLSGFFGVLPRK